jgi:hypothetical protein
MDDEFRMLRARLAEIERRTRPEDAMTDEYTGEGQSRTAEELRAADWHYDEQLEEVGRRLAVNSDDPAVSGGLRMRYGFYARGKLAAKRVGKDTAGGDR